MKKILFKKNDIAKVVLVVFGLVGFSSYVFSAPPGPTPASGDVADIIDFGKVPQSKNCGGVGLLNTTFSVCHDAGTAVNGFGFATEGLLSLGPIIAEGTLMADLSQVVSAVAGEAHDALRLTTGKQQNITTILTNKNIVGVWSDFLSDFAQGRFGRLDAERLILTEKNPFASNTFGVLRTVANEYRATSYTNTVGALPNIDIAGTTNLGHGNYCYRTYRDCSNSSGGAGGANMYINRIGRNYTSCKDIDPAQYPQLSNASTAEFTCDTNRTAPGTSVGSIRLMPSHGWGYLLLNGNFCIGGNVNTNTLVSNLGGDSRPIYMENEDDFYFGTAVFLDPYLEHPIMDGFHQGNVSPLDTRLDNNYPGGYGVQWFETKQGIVTQIGDCSGGAPMVFNNMYQMYSYVQN